MSYPNINKNTKGRDFNFFERVDVSSATFGDHPDLVVTFVTNGALFLNEGNGIVEFSFNGNTVHGSLNSADPSKGIIYDNRVVSTIWLRRVSGDPSVTVRVEAW
jgi:hypothetical protein